MSTLTLTDVLRRDNQSADCIDLVAAFARLESGESWDYTANAVLVLVEQRRRLKRICLPPLSGDLDAFVEQLADIRATRSLEHLDIQAGPKAGITGTGARAIASAHWSEQLQTLRLQGHRLGDGVTHFTTGGFPNLAQLSLRACGLGPAGAKALSDSPLSARLECHALVSNELGDEGAISFARSEHVAGLTELDFGDNGISQTGAAALSESLPALAKLLLSDNPIGDDGFRRLTSGLPALTELAVARCKVTPEAIGRALNADCWPHLARLHHDGPADTELHNSARTRGVELVLDKDATSDLLLSARLGRERQIKAALKAGADPNAVDSDGYSCLWLATKTSSVICVKVLLEHGADPARKSSRGNTPAWLAAKRGTGPVLRALVEAGADVSDPSIADVATGSALRVLADLGMKGSAGGECQSLNVGDRVSHGKFGQGTVDTVSPSAAGNKIGITFEDGSTRVLLEKFLTAVTPEDSDT